MALEIGQPAPDFTLYSTQKTPVTLSEQRGRKVLLLFFPLAFSSVCTAEMCSVSGDLKTYEALNATVFGISVDSVYSLKKFKEEEKIGFELLSDFNKEASQAYGAVHEQFGYGMRGVSRRAAFIIDENGILQYAEVLDNPGLQPDFAAIQKSLNAAGR